MVQVSLSAHLQGLAEAAQAAALTLPGPFFLYSSVLSQGLWRCRRRRVCLAPQHLPASRSLPTHLPPSCTAWGGGESPQGVRSPSIGMQVSPREVRVEGICQVWDSGRDTEGHLSHHLCFPVPLLLGQNWALN